MAVCVQCGAKVGFLDGYMTRRGRLCNRCREIETLVGRLAGLPLEGDPWPLRLALEEKPAALEDARRLAELDPARASLRIALDCLALGRGETVADETSRATALETLFRATREAKWLDGLVALGRAGRAAELLREARPETRADWITALAAIAAAGARSEALAAAFALGGGATRELARLVARLARADDFAALRDWLRRARFVSVDDWSDLLARLPAGGFSTAQLAEIHAAVRARLSPADQLLLAAAQPDESGEAFAAVKTLTPEIMGALEKLADSALRDRLLDLLARGAEAGPLAERACRLAARLADTPERRAGLRRVLERAEAWRLGKELMPEIPGEEWRGICRERMAAREADSWPRFARPLELLLAGQRREGRLLLGKIAAEAEARAPLARLAALGLLALASCADLDAALALELEVELIAKRRKTMKPLADEGALTRLLPDLNRDFLQDCRNLMTADTLPALALRGPSLAATNEAWKTIVGLSDRHAERLAAAAEKRDAAALTETLLWQPQAARRFGEMLMTVMAEGGAGAPSRWNRARLYGCLARRLLAPLQPKSDKSEMTGPRELAVECAARAVCFMPSVALTSTGPWTKFHDDLAGALRHLGYDTHYFRRQPEIRPIWTDVAEMTAPAPTGASARAEAAAPPAADYLPPLDAARALTLAMLYQPEPDLTPEAPKEWWRASS